MQYADRYALMPLSFGGLLLIYAEHSVTENAVNSGYANRITMIVVL